MRMTDNGDDIMPRTSNHPSSSLLKCPLCNKYPNKKTRSARQWVYYSCDCYDAPSGWITSDAIGSWNYLIEDKQRELQVKLARKLGIVD